MPQRLSAMPPSCGGRPLTSGGRQRREGAVAAGKMSCSGCGDGAGAVVISRLRKSIADGDAEMGSESHGVLPSLQRDGTSWSVDRTALTLVRALSLSGVAHRRRSSRVLLWETGIEDGAEVRGSLSVSEDGILTFRTRGCMPLDFAQAGCALDRRTFTGSLEVLGPRCCSLLVNCSMANHVAGKIEADGRPLPIHH